ncbi:MAG TPA: zinc dependent phospholipase C family protein [Bryobacteraceae bacterium]|nr:zinc dependent phospholipase C family protein [Bryobacteraceae bacterium]
MAWRLTLISLLLLPSASAYSVLTHEAMIDSAWEGSIKPLLLRRYPNATSDELLKARGYAYGGAIIQDLGYYPFGSRFFSDLVHYVRGGEFIESLVRNAQDLNEFAFSLGALAHDAADNCGHPIGVNPVVPMVYPKLRARFGPIVTYEKKPSAHLKVEFGFDVVQVARGNYAPNSFHDFIGFDVAKPLLDRAFHQTYGMSLKDVFLSVDLALGTYRYSVSQIIPKVTRVAWQMKKDEIAAARPGITRDKFVYNLSRASFEREWGREYKRPGLFSRLLAALFRIIPKSGPFRALAFHAPGPDAEKLFMQSFNVAIDRYRKHLAAVGANNLRLQDLNFDTGEVARFGQYKMADEAWERFVREMDLEKGIDRGAALAVKDFYDGALPPDPKTAAAVASLVKFAATAPAPGR